MKVAVLLASLFMVACGSSSTTDSVANEPPTVEENVQEVHLPQSTPIPLPQITYEWLDEKMWSHVEDGKLTNLTLETMCEEWQDVEPYRCTKKGNEYHFHIWLYDGTTIDSEQLFFAVGVFTINSDTLCFSNIAYWQEVPPNPFFSGKEDVCLIVQREDDVLTLNNKVFISTPL